MARRRASPILNDATSQLDRTSGAPAPEKVEVDGRSLAQLLAFAAGYGALIQFYDLEDQPDGDWAAFFASDPTVAHALHASLDLAGTEAALEAMLKAVRDADEHPGRLAPLRRLLAALARLLAILDRGPQTAGDSEAQVRAHRPGNGHERLGDPLRRLQHHLSIHSLEAGLRDHFHGWGETLIDLIDEVAPELIAALSRSAAEAAEALEQSLQSGDHAPQAALYNAFVLLFAEQRRTLNRFPRRLVDFYYGAVLDQHGLAAQPDTVFLTFVRAEGVDQASVPRGALFNAGTDSAGAEVNYAAEIALEVTPAAVEAISVHRMTHIALSPASGELIPTGVLSGDVALEPTGWPTTSFPLFGANKAGRHGALTLQPATLGFCVTSPTLMLAGGQRTIEIGLALSLPRQVLPAIETRLGVANVDWNHLMRLLAAAIGSSFDLHYSTAGGWMAVDGFTVTPDPAAGDEQAVLFTIGFELPPDAPPLVALSTTPVKGAPEPTFPADTWPVSGELPAVVGGLKLSDLEKSVVFWILSSIDVDSVSVDVEVEGLEELTLTTPNGPADTTQNFAPLGLAPTKYSTLKIYSPELFIKTVDRISVSIDWAGLPVTSTGFEGYYQNYVLDADGVRSPTPLFDNGTFQIAFSVVNPGAWDVSCTPQPLFQTGPPPTPASGPGWSDPPVGAPVPDAPVLRTSVLIAPGVRSTSASPYYNPAASTLNLALVAPDYAFGNILYSSSLMAATAAMSAAASAAARGRSGPPTPSPPEPPALPNPPWLPTASTLSVDYAASVRLTLCSPGEGPCPTGSGFPAPSGSGDLAAVELSLWHIGPFGSLTPPVAPNGGNPGMLPHVGVTAALYIQLSAQVSQISLLFVLSAGPDGWWDDPPPMAWEQYVHGDWVAVTLLGDGTDGLCNSGIVTLAPQVVAGGGKPRLRVRARGATDNAPIVQAVIANAVSARWVGPGGAEGLGTPLPAGTIKKPVDSLVGVASVGQPMQSFGGRPAAAGRSFQKWMAERLRHKGFAIDAWDYARLALEAVPSLWQVAVVPAVDEKTGHSAPGRVWLVAVAGPDTPNISDSTVPSVDLATLSEIGETLRGAISPFVKLTVTNPRYIRLTVTAEISFDDQNSPAYWIERLQADLVKWLSPWPDPALGPRPEHYYTRRAVAQFIRRRPYVEGVDRLEISPDESEQGVGYHYLTSALQHVLTAAPAKGRGDRAGGAPAEAGA